MKVETFTDSSVEMLYVTNITANEIKGEECKKGRVD